MRAIGSYAKRELLECAEPAASRKFYSHWLEIRMILGRIDENCAIAPRQINSCDYSGVSMAQVGPRSFYGKIAQFLTIRSIFFDSIDRNKRSKILGNREIKTPFSGQLNKSTTDVTQPWPNPDAPEDNRRPVRPVIPVQTGIHTAVVRQTHNWGPHWISVRNVRPPSRCKQRAPNTPCLLPLWKAAF